MSNGCIRVYSGLMDMMTDSELRGVIGHEMGHVALGHSKKAMQQRMRYLPRALPPALPAMAWQPPCRHRNWVT